MRPLPEVLTHKQRVTRQYKKVLVTLRDHAGFYRDKWYLAVGKARDAYELHRFIDNPTEMEIRVQEGDKWLEEHKHWAPYKLPHVEDGTKWQRNDPVPEELMADDRLIDFEAELMREFDTPEANPLHKQTWRLDL